MPVGCRGKDDNLLNYHLRPLITHLHMSGTCEFTIVCLMFLLSVGSLDVAKLFPSFQPSNFTFITITIERTRLNSFIYHFKLDNADLTCHIDLCGSKCEDIKGLVLHLKDHITEGKTLVTKHLQLSLHLHRM